MKFTEYILKTYAIDIDSTKEGFINVDTFSDVRAFIDPFKIARCNEPICVQMQQRILEFYRVFLTNIKSGNITPFLEAFHEVKPIRLGYAGDSFKGNGIGSELAFNMMKAIKNSKAFQTGKIKDLEDFTFMIDNVSDDRISDLVSNIIYDELIIFTNRICAKFKIPTTSSYFVKDGLTFFDIDDLSVKKFTAPLPLDNSGRPFILVPLCISKENHVSLKNSSDYYDHGIVVHLMRNKDLFKLLTDKEYDRKYKKKDVKELINLKYYLLKPGSVKFANYYIDEYDNEMESVKIYKEFRYSQNIKNKKVN